MKIIKTFEEFDFSQTIPVTSKENLTLFYSCEDCDYLWKKFNEECVVCDKCGSKEIEELSPSEYYEILGSRGDKNRDDIDSERKLDSDTLVDLVNLKNNKHDVYKQ